MHGNLRNTGNTLIGKFQRGDRLEDLGLRVGEGEEILRTKFFLRNVADTKFLITVLPSG